MSLAGGLQEAAFVRYLLWVHRSSRIRVEGGPAEGAIVTFWHEALLSALAATAGMPGIAIYLWEQPGSGAMTRLLRKLRFEVILARADNAYGVREVRCWLRRPGAIVAITLDGPNGPRQVAKAGVVRLARMANAPLRPLQVIAPKALELPSWDRCVVPAGRDEIILRLLEPPPVEATPPEAARWIEECLKRTAAPHPARGPRLGDMPFHAWARACTLPLAWGKLAVNDAAATYRH